MMEKDVLLPDGFKDIPGEGDIPKSFGTCGE